MTKDELQKVMHGLVSAAIDYVDGELSPARATATDFYWGRKFGNEEPGRSQFVSTDVRDSILAIMPPILRVLVGPERAVEFRARTAAKMEEAEQATDYINHIFMEENEGFLLTHSVLKDGLLKKIGAFKYFWDDTSGAKQYSPKGLTETQLAMLQADPNVTITDLSDGGIAMVSGPDGQQVPTQVYNAELSVQEQDGKARVVVVPPEELIHNREARSLDEAVFFAHSTEKTHGELIAMGIDPKIVREYGTLSGKRRQSNEESIARDMNAVVGVDATEDVPGNDRAQYVEAYVKIDYDGDGVAELRKICTLGEDDYIVENVPVDERPFALFTPDPEPHTLVGLSWADLTQDIQKVKSMVIRSLLDSLAQSIHPRTWYVQGKANLADVLNTAVGAPIRVTSATDVGEFAHNFVGQQAFPVLEYFDDTIERRTAQNKGVNGLDMDALQSTEKAAAKAAITSSQSRQEIIVRVFAEGTLKRLFKGLLRLLVQNQPRSRVIRLRNQWVEVDPRYWDADMDLTVNVTLGTGLTEEKVATLMEIAAKQEAILQTLGPNNPLVNLKQYRDTLAEIAELRGRKDAARYFMPVDLQKLQEMQEAAANAPPPPSPEMMLAQAQVEIEKLKAERQVQIEQMKAERQLAMEQMKMEQQAIAAQNDFLLKQRELELEDDRERDKAAADIALRRLEIMSQGQIAISQQQLDQEIEHARMLVVDAPGETALPASADAPAPPKPKRKRVSFERDENGRVMGAMVEDLGEEYF